MQIGPVAAVPLVAPVDKPAVQQTVEKLLAAQQVLQPAPPLRPNLEDKILMTQALLALREV